MRIGIPEKLALTLFFAVAALSLPWFAATGLVGAALLLGVLVPALRPFDEKAATRFRKVFWVLLAFVALTTASNGVLMPAGAPSGRLGPLDFYEGGLRFGLTTGCRVLLIATAFGLLFRSTTIAEFARYLNRIGLPSSIVTTLLLSLHFLDSLPERIQQIFIAQESRGAPLRGSLAARTKSFFLLLTPLVLSSIVESIERSTALELRGFHSGASLGSPEPIESRRRPSGVTIVLLVLTVAIAIYGMWSWLSPSR